MNIVRKYSLLNGNITIKIPDSYIRIKNTGMNNGEYFRDKSDNTIIIMECEIHNVNVSEQNILMYNDIKRRCGNVSEPECTYRVVNGIRQSKLCFIGDFDKHYILFSFHSNGLFYSVISCNVDGQLENWKKDIAYILDSVSIDVEGE